MREFVIQDAFKIPEEREFLEKYLQLIGKKNILLPEQEFELFQKYKNGDEAAGEILIKSNLRFVVTVAKQYQGQGLSLSDLINEGNLGLIIALDRFDPTTGFKFISYAIWWIRQSILASLASHRTTVRHPISIQEKKNKLKSFINSFLQKNEREPTFEEISEFFNMKSDYVLEITKESRSISLSEPKIIGINKNQEGSTLEEFIEDEYFNPEKDIEKLYDQNFLSLLLSKLTPRQRDIICLAYGIGCEARSRKNIGETYGVTQNAVGITIKNAIKKMRKMNST